ncbi:hyccin-like [Oppia nitens]|uniref:hyccin-like n=1 Tax=Oppia nitens TaxID=1686743 RepID=UPI0023D992F5|nr:hyccin-like [Oppia nitens]
MKSYMADQQIINDWLNCGSHEDIEFVTNETLIDSLLTYFDDFKCDEQSSEAICSKLYAYYRSNGDDLRVFSLAFIPQLIGVHIMHANNWWSNEMTKCGGVDAMLLGVYNLEVVDNEGQLRATTFRVMSLSKPSIYHEPSPHSAPQNQSSLLTEHNILKLDNFCGDLEIPLFGPYPEMEAIVANNRMDIMTVLMKVFNQYISSVNKKSLSALCRMTLRLLRQGSINISVDKLNSIPLNAFFTSNSSLITRNSTKIPLSSQFLVEITNSIYYCLFNGVTDLALEVLDFIHNRAVNYLYTDVLLMTNAIRNSLLLSSGQPSDGPMGINIALSPTSSTSLTATGIAKIAITNASFKTRKLPDDIPIVAANTDSTTNIGSNKLGSINEETDDGKETNDKTNKSHQQKSVTTTSKKTVIQKLKEIKDKKKDAHITQKGAKYKTENGDLISNKLLSHEDNDYGSDTSGISDTKLSFSEETIPLNVINTNKTYFDTNDDDVSDDASSGQSSETGAKVPLVCVNSDPTLNSITSNNKHNNETLNV